jgi:dolichyl-phosphooligosaccharide-protein glycotransferase
MIYKYYGTIQGIEQKKRKKKNSKNSISNIYLNDNKPRKENGGVQLSKKRHKKREEPTKSDEITIDFNNLKEKSTRTIKEAEKISENKYVRYGWIALLIIITIIISAYVRLGPLNLPITDTWAENQVENHYKNLFAQQIQQERPNLPESGILRLAEEQYQEYYRANKADLDEQKKQLSQQYKRFMQNDNGMTYLLGIDEYFFYSHAKWYQQEGHFGTDMIDDESRFMLRRGRFGMPVNFMMHPFLINVVHDVWKPFNPNFNIEWASFYIAIILIGLAAIPLFFLNKRISGTTGGFIATVLVLTAIPLVGRTMGGSSDDDVHTILWTFTMMALLFNAIGKKTKTIAIMAGLAGLVTAIFMISWSGWWYGYLLVLGSAGLYVLYEYVRKAIEKKKLTKQDWIRNSTFLVVFFVSALIFSMMISPLSNRSATDMATSIITAPAEPLKLVARLGAGADLNVAAGEYPLWPNVLRTVAELNNASVRQIISGAGTLGNTAILMFYLALAGIITLFLRYREDPKYIFYGLVLMIWTAGMIFVATSAVRFILMAAIPILISVGALIGYIVGPLSEKIKKNTTIRQSVYVSVVSIALVLILLWAPISNARTMSENAIPIFDDAWYDAIYELKADAEQYEQRGIISSWWDYGHFFQAYGEQSVTFDGADQGKRIYWMGRALLTSDADEAHDILKVMNCGQEEPYDLLEDLEGRYLPTQIKLAITRMNREDARAYLLEYLNAEQTEEILALTHCEDLYPMYFVTSGDMVGKAPVWSHFGGWNFTKAYFYYYLRHLPLTDVYELTAENLGMSQEETRALYNEARLIRNEDNAAQWISSFDSYLTRQKTGCTQTNNTVTCTYDMALQQDATSTVVLRRAIIPLDNLENTQLIIQSINRATGTPMGQDVLKPSNVIIEQNGEFEKYSFENAGIGFDLLLMDEGLRYTSLLTSPSLSTSIFTRLFFMEGRGADLEMFEKISDKTSFRGERIIIWKVHP